MRRIDPERNLASYDLDVIADELPFHTRVTPVDFNGQKRFNVQINNGEEHVFAWDEEMMSLRALDEGAATLSDSFVRELSNRLVKTRHIE